mmetsp:Transcript_59884/g.117731  ORF Transcript_59884/g.117731 Transcript_59884/m.117731 type:complete len:502 (-) Transcript_59884:110-1615(-)
MSESLLSYVVKEEVSPKNVQDSMQRSPATVSVSPTESFSAASCVGDSEKESINMQAPQNTDSAHTSAPAEADRVQKRKGAKPSQSQRRQLREEKARQDAKVEVAVAEPPLPKRNKSLMANNNNNETPAAVVPNKGIASEKNAEPPKPSAREVKEQKLAAQTKEAPVANPKSKGNKASPVVAPVATLTVSDAQVSTSTTDGNTAAPNPKKNGKKSAPAAVAVTLAASDAQVSASTTDNIAAPIPKKNRKKTVPADMNANQVTPAAPAPTASAPAPAVVAAAVPAKGNKPPVRLNMNQQIALHAVLTVLQQGIPNADTSINANHGALKAHLLHGAAKLGYSVVEGTPQTYQQIGWSYTTNCLDYTKPISQVAEGYPQTSKTKADLKLASPALFLQCKAYPAFGVNSPLLTGMKPFKNGFLRIIDEVAQGESDAFVFSTAAKVYEEMALIAAPSLPVVSAIERCPRVFQLPHTTKAGVSCQLRCILCNVGTIFGDSYYVGAIFP